MKNTKGSITVEAAIVLPIFLCVIISIAFLIKVVYVNEKINYAINGTAEEMAAASYLYHVSGLQEKQDSFRDTIEDTFERVFEDAPEELKNFATYLGMGAFEDLKTEICIPLVKLYIKKYLSDIYIEDIDFSHSSFFEEGTNNIDIIARYRLKIPVPINILPELFMVQRATTKAWLGGDEDKKGSVTGYDNIWSLNNFERGKKIRDIFGGNLPFNFPVLSRYEDGKATIIKSMDTTAETYQRVEAVTTKIREYIDNLERYRGQELPWGKDKIIIKERDIHTRELILVIPSDELLQETEIALGISILEGIRKGIVLKVERYGNAKD